MDKFRRYLAAFNGTAQWNDVKPLYDDAFHPNCRVVTADGELSKEQWEEMVKGLLARGAKAADFEVIKEEGDTVYYQLNIKFSDGEQLHLTSKGTLKEGQLIRVEPVDPAKYSELVKRSS